MLDIFGWMPFPVCGHGAIKLTRMMTYSSLPWVKFMKREDDSSLCNSKVGRENMKFKYNNKDFVFYLLESDVANSYHFLLLLHLTLHIPASFLSFHSCLLLHQGECCNDDTRLLHPFSSNHDIIECVDGKHDSSCKGRSCLVPSGGAFSLLHQWHYGIVNLLISPYCLAFSKSPWSAWASKNGNAIFECIILPR